MVNYKENLKNVGYDYMKLKEMLDGIMELEEQEKIDKIIESIKDTLIKMCSPNNIAIILDFVKKYYEKFGNVSPFLNSGFNDKLRISNANSMLTGVQQDVIKSDWFFELIKPTNARKVSIAEFQAVIDNINIQTGVSLQEKASRYYSNVRSAIKPYVDSLIREKDNIVEHFDEKYNGKLSAFINLLLSDQGYNNCFEYVYEDLTDIENNELQNLERKMEKSLLFIKLYVDLAIGELFEATPTVVYKDMLEMLYFYESLSDEDKFLSPEPIFDDLNIFDVYLDTVYLATKGSVSEIDDYIEKLREINIRERFYDDMLAARRKSEELLTSKLYSFPESDICDDAEVTNRWPGAKIYDLRNTDKKYNLVVRRLSSFNEESGKTHRFECYSYVNDRFNHVHASKGENFLSGTFGYGYLNIESDHLVFASRDDSNTVPTNTEIRANEQSILANGEFSLIEINIANDISEDGYVPKKPDYIIAYNEIDENIYDESLRLGIPILLLDPRSYESEVDLHFLPYDVHYNITASIDSDYYSKVSANRKI